MQSHGHLTDARCLFCWLLAGISAPFNDPYFDPLGFSTTQNPVSMHMIACPMCVSPTTSGAWHIPAALQAILPASYTHYKPFALPHQTLSVQEAKRWRESELAHGRVSMLAALGWIVQEEFHPVSVASANTERWRLLLNLRFCVA